MGAIMPADLASARRSPAGIAPLRAERQGPILVLTLDRPAARNSLSEAMIAALHREVHAAAETRDIRAIVLTGNGPAFCAGHDMKEMTARRTDADGGQAYFRDLMGCCSQMMQAIVRSPKPVIAAVQATATAAGCQLVASCDLAVASSAAKFATPGVNIGLFCSTPMVALSRNVPRKRAMEMLLLGELMTAEQAADWGLVNRVVAPDRVLAEAMAMAELIASKSSATIAIGKRAFYDQLELRLSDAYAHASEVMVENMLYRDAAEGIGAFIDKRKPEWKGC